MTTISPVPHPSFKSSLDAFIQARRQLLDWFRQDAAPAWQAHGIDWVNGGFFEQLTPSGPVLDAPRRTRVVARQLYVFATAPSLGCASTHTNHVLSHGLAFLLQRLRRPDHLFASSASPDGWRPSTDFDLYEQAFALFALARVHPMACDQQPAVQDAAHQLIQALDTQYRHPILGYQESSPPTAPLRANPHMHLLEATLAWEDVRQADDQDHWADRSDALVQLALTRLIDPRSGALSECFDLDWQRPPNLSDQAVEPGHQLEWAWLLIQWAHKRPQGVRAPAIAAAQRLAQLAQSHGICARRGVAINQLDGTLQVTDAKAKLWPQTERIKAWCALLALADSPQTVCTALDGAAQAMAGLMPYLRQDHPGLWHEVMLPDGSFQVEPCRASSLYHIVCALETLHQVTLVDH